MARVYFITGSSTGIGASLVQHILDTGNHVYATARNPSNLRFTNANDKNFAVGTLDLEDPASITSGFTAAIAKFGRIDVVINNGGYGLSGPFEDLSETDISRQMTVNFTGVLLCTKAAMKAMRHQEPKGGLIMQVTSIGGRIGFPWMSMYSASKFAIEGFTEAVSQEVDPAWGINFTCIEPGGFRTDFFTRSMTYTNSDTSAYDMSKVKASLDMVHKGQLGIPAKGAKAIFEVSQMEKPPKKIILGSDAYNWLDGWLIELHKELHANKDISFSTDADDINDK
ncbi:short-chain dehydrogenase [Stagonosporopsis vannaccii]|nr:short-chain dehydrogenase [Stagonosporopsis vannaccii]